MKQTVCIASPESQRVHVWDLNHEGALALTQTVDVLGQVQPMVISPDKYYLYVGVRPEFHVLTCRTAPDDGALTFAAESALPGSSTHISADHQGQFAFIDSYNAGNVSITCLEDGLPVGVVDVVEGLGGCHSADILPDNRTLWVPALEQDHIRLFTISGNDRLVAQNPAEMTTVEGASPRHMVFHPNEQCAYCIDELSGSVDVWELKDPHSNIKCVQALDMMPGNLSDTRWTADIHITPGGRHLYACDRTVNLIIVFSIPEDGSVLSREGFQPMKTQPRDFNVDHNGKYLVAAGQKSHHVSVYETADEEGLLHEKGRYAVGQGPMWVVVNVH